MSTYSKVMQIVGLFGWLAISFIASAIGAVASLQADAFYIQLVRPNWAPPPSIFGPVWIVLYALMGIAAWLVWRVDGFRTAKVWAYSVPYSAGSQCFLELAVLRMAPGCVSVLGHTFAVAAHRSNAGRPSGA